MAFHVACPITCRRICDCELGFPGHIGRGASSEAIARLQGFLWDPWVVRGASSPASVQVEVPPVPQPPPSPEPSTPPGEGEVEAGGARPVGGGKEESAWAASVRARRAELQRQAAEASLAAEDYVRRLEGGGRAVEVPEAMTTNLGEEEQASSIIKIICRICFSGENEGNHRAFKMLPCRICGKMYHRSCLKVWGEHRDLFHWSSWSCPSCRTCEVCHRTGDPTKYKFCKRCDSAYHCYCQQPPHKNVSHGPFLCPKHTRCHSCCSTVPGSGLSTRWFLNYTCCDACGRLFVKGKYCPVCLKVYRDSEMTPMVCCDICQKWVHCVCDGISDEKYQQFEADKNLYYTCPACRGDCYKVKDIEDAVHELWRRRDETDRDLVASLRAAAGLPFLEEIFSKCPYSDDEESAPVILKNEHAKSLKFSVKGITTDAIKKSKGVKNLSKKSFSKDCVQKRLEVLLIGEDENPNKNTGNLDAVRFLYSSPGDQKPGDVKLFRSPERENISYSPDRNPCKIIEDPIAKTHGSHVAEGDGRRSGKNEITKKTTLVEHMGTNAKKTSSPKSENSSIQREPDLTSFSGKKGPRQKRKKYSGSFIVDALTPVIIHPVGEDKSNEIRTGNVSEKRSKNTSHVAKTERPSVFDSPFARDASSSETDTVVENTSEHISRSDEAMPLKHLLSMSSNRHRGMGSIKESSLIIKASNDPKALLKLKLSPYIEQRSSSNSGAVEEKKPVKGQRSKRKRPYVDAADAASSEKYEQSSEDGSINEVADAKWILEKLGKDVVGKRIEVHEVSDNSWHKGTVSDVTEGALSLLVRLDDGTSKILELSKQRFRFIPPKKMKT